MTNADLVEITQKPAPTIGSCEPYQTKHMTPESCKLRKEYALESRDPEVEKCRTCKGLKRVRKNIGRK